MLNPATIYHRPRGSWAYAIDNNTIRITLRAGKNSIKTIKVIHYDKYRQSEKYEIPMKKVVCDGTFDYWQCEVVPKYKRLAYHFVIGDKNPLYFSENGLTKTFDNSTEIHDFQYAYINPNDVYKVPEWLRSGCIYQIFPDGFDNFGRKKPLPAEYCGGTFAGIIKHLNYLHDLGVTVLYFNPIHKSTTYHRYDIIDYFSIDKTLGTEAEFRKLVNECHKRKMKVVMDAVFNHTSNQNPIFLDISENGKKSRYYNWYIIHKMKGKTPVEYETFAFEKYMPKLNTANPEVRDFILDALKYWIKKYDIDGWRFDVGNEKSIELIRRIREELKDLKPDFYLLGEIWHNPYPFVCGDMYDGVTNFALKFLLMDLGKEKISAETFVNRYNNYFYNLPLQANIASSNFICNHDTKRILTEMGSEKLVKFIIPFQFMLTGIPTIYYGEELGMENNPNYTGDKAARTLMEWDKLKDNTLLDYYKKLIKLKKTNKCLIFGDQRVYERGGLIFIERIFEDQKVTMVANSTSKKIKFKTPLTNYLDDTNNDYIMPKEVKIFIAK